MSSTTSHSDRVAANKAAGESAERSVQDHVPQLGLVPDDVVDHYDAIATATIDPTSDLPIVGICLVERGTRVEIKSVVKNYTDGARGRFYVRRNQHERLLEAAGVYLFAVCSETSSRDVLALKIVPAVAVDDAIYSWLDGGPGRSDYAQLAWSNIFDDTEVSAGV